MKTRLDALVGETLAGRYRIERIIGRGGMGAVFEARQLDGGQTVAVKVMADDDAASVKRFKREAQTLTRLRHPNVVRILSFGQAEGFIFLVMEILQGRPLTSLLKRHGVLPPAVAIDVTLQIASALHAAHEVDIVHRDVKPGNIFLIRSDHPTGMQAKVLDFGIAKTMDLEETRLTRDGSLVGTPLYMAPEQIRNTEIDSRTDVYALACVLYEMLAGQAPFHSTNMAEVLVKHLQDKPPPLSKFLDTLELKGIPPALDAALNRALAKDPKLRHGSMREFWNELNQARSTMPRATSWKPALESADSSLEDLQIAGTLDAPPTTGQRKAITTASRQRPETKPKKSIAPWIGGALLVAALVALVVFVAYASQKSDHEREALARLCAIEGTMECTKKEDGTSDLELCRDGAFQVIASCPLTDPCATDSHSGRCGVTGLPVAELGSGCERVDDVVCDLAKSRVVQCKFGTWASIRNCGDKACEAVGNELRCQDNVFSEGDFCDFPDTNFVCSADGANVLSCKNKRTVVQHSCAENEEVCASIVENGQPVILCKEDPDATPPPPHSESD